MVLRCGACGGAIEVDGELSNGHLVVCPICGEQTQIDKPTRIEVPVGVVRDPAPVVAEDEVPHKEKPKLRVIRDRDSGANSVNPIDKRKIYLAEEKLKMYEDLKHKAWRRKFFTNLFSVIVLLALPIAGWFIYSEWVMHTKRVELNEELKAAEERARSEREALERRAREEQEAKERRQKQERERQAQEAKKAEERAAREQAREQQLEERNRIETQRKLMVEQYRSLSSALCENEFDLFNKNVTNDLAKAGGDLCYCFPTETYQIPLYWVEYSTTGDCTVTEILPDGTTSDVNEELLQAKIKDQEYLVSRGDKVYFQSRRKNKRMGELPKNRAIDPAEVFFGDMSKTLERLKPTYDELTFDIVFVPKGEKKQIECENVEFGCKYSLDNVQEAVEKAFPPQKTFINASKVKKFKRTVKFWSGSHIKRAGLGDDITYVPRTYVARPKHNVYYQNNAPGVWHTSHTRTRSNAYDNSYAEWQSLYNRALQEDQAEAAYYENERNRQSERVARARSSEERAWVSKIEKLISEGTLYYRIKKAKRNN